MVDAGATRGSAPGASPSTPTPARRIGVFGGTFDPPHIGHLVTAVNVRHALRLDVVLLVVAGLPWQKEGSRPISPAEDRLEMVRAAVAGIDGVEASSIEVQRSGPSYTADTLAQLHSENPGAELFTIVGADAAAGITTWERYRSVIEQSHMVVVDRPGAAAPLPPVAEWTRVEVPHLDVSSTDLRARFEDGRPLDFLVPAEVLRVVAARGLYRRGTVSPTVPPASGSR